MPKQEIHLKKVPEKMLAVRQHQPGGALIVEQVPVTRPGPGEVLVKMRAAPINPSDLSLIAGTYFSRSYPFTPGLEGSGEVVEAGPGLMGRLRLGKRVACTPDPSGDGTWAEYMKTSAMRTAPLPKGIAYEQGSMMLINPMTALALIERARTGKHKALVMNAAGSALGKMILGLAASYKIDVIGIVRREEQMAELSTLGAIQLLNSSEKEFEVKLHNIATELDVTLYLDAVTGSQTPLLLKAAPKGSTVIVYARLSGESMDIDPGFLIKEEKRIEGFQLGNWLQSKGMITKLRYLRRVKKELPFTLASRIAGTLPLDLVGQAIDHYKTDMSGGKWILKMGAE